MGLARSAVRHRRRRGLLDGSTHCSLLKKLLAVATVAEAATGMALLVVPSAVGRLLFGPELTGVSIPIARVLGIALLALGVACFPGSTALGGMLTYSAPATFFFYIWRPRRMGWGIVVAGGYPTRDPDRTSRARMVSIAECQTINQHKNL